MGFYIAIVVCIALLVGIGLYLYHKAVKKTEEHLSGIYETLNTIKNKMSSQRSHTPTNTPNVSRGYVSPLFIGQSATMEPMSPIKKRRVCFTTTHSPIQSPTLQSREDVKADEYSRVQEVEKPVHEVETEAEVETEKVDEAQRDITPPQDIQSCTLESDPPHSQ
jgi:hypothetical protein